MYLKGTGVLLSWGLGVSVDAWFAAPSWCSLGPSSPLVAPRLLGFGSELARGLEYLFNGFGTQLMCSTGSTDVLRLLLFTFSCYTRRRQLAWFTEARNTHAMTCPYYA